MLAALRQFGVIKTVKQLLMMKNVRSGTLVGTDRFGNEYYQGGTAFNRERFVIYANQSNNYGGYDSSQVTPEWHAWLHRITDEVPTNVKQPFFHTFKPNVSLCEELKYKPRSTVGPKFSPWVPRNRRNEK